MSYSSFLDKDSISILLEYQNINNKNLLKEQTPGSLPQPPGAAQWTAQKLGLDQRSKEQQETPGTSKYGLAETGWPNWLLKQLEWITTAPDNYLSLNPVDWLRWVGAAISIIDPTGVTSYPQLAEAWTAYNRVTSNPKATAATKAWFAGWLVVAGFNALPNVLILAFGVGGIAKPIVKGISKFKAGPKITEKAIEILQTIKNNPQLLEKIYKNIDTYTANINNPKPIRDCLIEIKKIIQNDKILDDLTVINKEMSASQAAEVLLSTNKLQELIKMWRGEIPAKGPAGQLSKGAAKVITKEPTKLGATKTGLKYGLKSLSGLGWAAAQAKSRLGYSVSDTIDKAIFEPRATERFYPDIETAQQKINNIRFIKSTTEQEYKNNVENYRLLITEFGKGFLKSSDVTGTGGRPEYSRDPNYQSIFIKQLKNAQEALLSDVNFFNLYKLDIGGIADQLLRIISQYVEDSPQNQNLINAVIQHNKALLRAGNIPIPSEFTKQ